MAFGATCCWESLCDLIKSKGKSQKVSVLVEKTPPDLLLNKNNNKNSLENDYCQAYHCYRIIEFNPIMNVTNISI